MARFAQWTFDVRDVGRMARFWSQALGYRVEMGDDGLVALGACNVDVGQTGEEPFVVLADPEGNEFCILRREPRGL